MRIKYNAPITLSFALVCTAILVLDQLTFHGLNSMFFSCPGNGSFSFFSPLSDFRLFSHVLGHSSWEHLIGNMTFILLLGPILEERHGSFNLLMMILLTAFITGIINALFFSTGLLGASGIVFMMILLVSFTNIRQKEIPLTFILIVLLFVSKEVINCFSADNIAQSAHLIGGACGSWFGKGSGRKV